MTLSTLPPESSIKRILWGGILGNLLCELMLLILYSKEFIMNIPVTVQEIKKPFKLVFMRGNCKLSDSEESDGKFTFDKNIVEGEIISCETWKKNEDNTLSTEKLTFPVRGNPEKETEKFPFTQETILAIIQHLKSAGQHGLIIKAK